MLPLCPLRTKYSNPRCILHHYPFEVLRPQGLRPQILWHALINTLRRPAMFASLGAQDVAHARTSARELMGCVHQSNAHVTDCTMCVREPEMSCPGEAPLESAVAAH